MTTVYYCSDLHLEFGKFDRELPTGDVLILAGDITLARSFLPTVSRNDEHAADMRKDTMDFFAEAARKFKKVFYLFGNHEGYGANISHLRAVLSPYTKKAIILENETFYLDENTILFGGPLWTDFNKRSVPVMQNIEGRLNDYRLIKIDDKKGTRRFIPMDAYKMHLKTRKALSKVAADNPDKRIIVATHHAPSFQGTGPGRDHYGYYSDLEDFIKKRPNITHWVHGHTHIQKTYQVHQCQVFANCRGYIGREYCAKTFQPDKFFEV